MYIHTKKPNTKAPQEYTASLIKQDLYDRLSGKLAELDNNMSEVRERLDKLSPDEWWKFHEFMIVRDTQGSLNLEGFKLDMGEVSLQYNTAFVAQIPPESRKAMEGMFSAWNLLHRISERGTEVNKDLLLNIHTVLYGRVNLERAGIFRTGYVRRPEFPKDFPPPGDLGKICDALIKKIDKSEDHPVIKALFVEYSVWSQQFFWDGNSRTSRLMRDLLLAQEGYMQIPVPENYRGMYEKHRVNAGLGNPEGFYTFMIDMLEREINQTREFLKMEPYKHTRKREDISEIPVGDNANFTALWESLKKQNTVIKRLVGGGDWDVEENDGQSLLLTNRNSGDTITALKLNNTYDVELTRGTTKRKFPKSLAKQFFLEVQFTGESTISGADLVAMVDESTLGLDESKETNTYLLNIINESDWTISGGRGKLTVTSASSNCFIELVIESGNHVSAKIGQGDKVLQLDDSLAVKIMNWAIQENEIAKRSGEKTIHGDSINRFFRNDMHKDFN